MTLSVQNSCNSLDAFKPLSKIGLLSLILIASLKRRIFQFLWRSIIIVFVCTKLILDVLMSCTSSIILSENSDGVNLVILNIYCTPLHKNTRIIDRHKNWNIRLVSNMHNGNSRTFSHKKLCMKGLVYFKSIAIIWVQSGLLTQTYILLTRLCVKTYHQHFRPYFQPFISSLLFDIQRLFLTLLNFKAVWFGSLMNNCYAR